MIEDEILQEIRIKNIQILIEKYGSRRRLGAVLGYPTGSMVAHLLTKRREVSEKTVRKWERKLMLTPNWFDIAHEHPVDAAQREAKASLDFKPVDPPRISYVAAHLNTLGAPSPIVNPETYMKAAKDVCLLIEENRYRISKEKLENIISKVYDRVTNTGKPISKSIIIDMLDIAHDVK